MYLRLFAFLCASLLASAQSDPKTWYERGQNYSKLSVNTFEQLLKTAPESGYVLALLGEVKTRDHQYTAALYAYNEAAKRMPKLRGVRSAIADIYVALGKADEAASAETAEQKLGLPDCAIEKLYCDYAAGRYDAVVKAAKLRKTPEGLYWLSRAYNELAIESFARLGSLPESPELHQVKADLLMNQAQYREAAQEWRAILKNSPSDENARHQLATSLYLSQEYKTTLPELKQFLAAEPDSANLNFFVGDSLLQTEQVDEAIPYLEKALKIDPNLLVGRASLGLAYARTGESEKAIPHLKAALELDRDGSLHYQLARAYQATGQAALSKAMMDKYQQLRKQAAASSPTP